jgi:hypothetical protein
MSKNFRKPTKIMLIRHGEKPQPARPPHGISHEGKTDKECLTVRGWQRAGALASFFAPSNGSRQIPNIGKPHFLFASKPLRRGGSQRAVQTLTPLAEKLGMKVNIRYPKEQLDRMLEEVFSCEGVVLICWQHDFLPIIANRILGKSTVVAQKWPEGRFDMVWVFDRTPKGDIYRFKEVPQCLLSGDSTTHIS